MLADIYTKELYDFLIMMPRELIEIIVSYILIIPCKPKLLQTRISNISNAGMCMIEENILAVGCTNTICLVNLATGNVVGNISIPKRNYRNFLCKLISSPMPNVLYYDGSLWTGKNYTLINSPYIYIRGVCAVGSKLLYYYNNGIVLDNQSISNNGLRLDCVDDWVYDARENQHLIMSKCFRTVYIVDVKDNKISMIRRVSAYGDIIYAWNSYKIWNMNSVVDLLTNHELVNSKLTKFCAVEVVVANNNIYLQLACCIAVLSREGKISWIEDLSPCDLKNHHRRGPKIYGNAYYTVLATDTRICFFGRDNQCLHTIIPATQARLVNLLFTADNMMVMLHDDGSIYTYTEEQI